MIYQRMQQNNKLPNLSQLSLQKQVQLIFEDPHYLSTPTWTKRVEDPRQRNQFLIDLVIGCGKNYVSITVMPVGENCAGLSKLYGPGCGHMSAAIETYFPSTVRVQLQHVVHSPVVAARRVLFDFVLYKRKTQKIIIWDQKMHAKAGWRRFHNHP